MSDEAVDINTQQPPAGAEGQPEPAVTEPAERAQEPRRAEDDVRDAIASLKGDKPAEDRPRGPDGKFIAKAEDGAPAATPKPEQQAKPADKVSDQDDKPTTGEATSSPPAGPPAGWSADAKAQWSQLPPAIQAAVSRREQEVSDGFAQKSQELKHWQGIEQQLAPRRQAFAQMGYQNDGQVIEHLLTFADAYSRDPTALIRHLATSAGLDLRQLAGQPAAAPTGQRPTASAKPPAGNGQIDPTIQNELNSLKKSMVERDRREALTAVERFGADPKHPHFEEVRQEMAAFLRAGEEDLEKAYERAVWSNPQVRAKMLAADSEAKAAAEAKAKADKAAAARAAAVSPRGAGPGGARPATMNGFDASKSDVHGAVREAIAMHSGQV